MCKKSDSPENIFVRIQAANGKKSHLDYHFDRSKNDTHRGYRYEVHGGKDVHFQLKHTGIVNIYFHVANAGSTTGGNVNVLFTQTNKSGENVLSRIDNLKGRVEVSRLLNYEKGDRLTVKLSGDGTVILSQPVVYDNLKNDYLLFLISVDTLRADFLEIYGNEDNISRNLTLFARDSVVFDNAFSTSSWTLPSHISLFTGMDVFNHYVYNSNMKLSDNISVFPETLIDRNLMLSFNAGIFLDSKYGYFRGFDLYDSMLWKKKDFNRRQSKFDSKDMFDKVRRVMDGSSPPTFFFLHTYQVHSPYHMHPELEFSRKLLKANYPKMKKVPQHLGTKIKGRRARFRKLPEWQKSGFVNLYKSEIEFFDNQFGLFVQFLKEKGIYDRSIIIVFSDHGEEFFDHSGWGHGSSLYNEVVKIPLIIKFPQNIFKGKRISENCSIIDIFPTLLDFLKMENKHKVDGRSLMGLIRGEGGGNERLLYSVLKYNQDMTPGVEKFPQKLAVIWKNFKLIYNFKYTDALKKYYSVYPPPPYVEYELYNLGEDPGEKNNLADNPQYQKVYKFLKQRIGLMKKNILNKKSKSVSFKISNQEKEKLRTLGYL